MFRIIRDTTWEAVMALLPLAVLVVVLQLTVLHAPLETVLYFLAGAGMVLVGTILFLVGVRTGILPLGRDIGAKIPEYESLLLIVIVALIFGFVITAAEPGVAVLAYMAAKADSGASSALVFVAATGMAILLTVALLRTLYGFPITHLLAIVYVIVLVLASFTPATYLPLAVDSGGVSAGPLTVPVFLALGLGFVSVLPRRSALTDGFGLIGIACAGPIIGIMLWGVIFS